MLSSINVKSINLAVAMPMTAMVRVLVITTTHLVQDYIKVFTTGVTLVVFLSKNHIPF